MLTVDLLMVLPYNRGNAELTRNIKHQPQPNQEIDCVACSTKVSIIQ